MELAEGTKLCGAGGSRLYYRRRNDGFSWRRMQWQAETNKSQNRVTLLNPVIGAKNLSQEMIGQ